MRVDLKVSFLLVFFILLFSGVNAQSIEDYLQKGDRFYQRKDYSNALFNYREALALDPHNAHTNYKAGISCLHEEEYGQAAVYLQIVYDQQPDIDPDIDYHLGMAYQKDHQFLKARQHFEALKGKNKRLAPLAKQKVAECTLADSLMKLPLKGRVDAVDGSVSSPFEDIAPLITEDGNILIFTSTRSTDDYQIKSGINDKDVYISRKADDHWATPQKISNSINVRSNDAATSVSQDGKTLLLHY